MRGRVLATYRAAFRDLEREVWILLPVSLVDRAGTMVLTFLVLYLTAQHEYSAVDPRLLGSSRGSIDGGERANPAYS